MKTKNVAVGIMGLSLTLLSGGLYADDMMNKTENAVEHPVTAVHESEAKSASTNTQEYEQQKKEAKATMDQAKKDYEKSLADNGATSDVTKAAKDRLADARKQYHKFAKKSAKAAHDLQEDANKVNQDKASQ